MLQTSVGRLLQTAALAGLLAATSSLILWRNQADVRAAPPAQGPTPLGINHQCTDPALQESPLNDTYQAATPLLPGQPQLHTLDSGGTLGTHDKDWFNFTVSAGQPFTLSTTIPAASILTTTEISLFTSAGAAQSDLPAASSTGGQLSHTAAAGPPLQLFWVRVRNPFAAAQNDTNSFCDVQYRLSMILPGKLDTPGSLKLAAGGPNRTLTYTLVLSNIGQMLAPVTVTDTFPTGVNATSVTVWPTSATTSLVTSTKSLTWVGLVTGYSSVRFTMRTQATEQAGSLRNTAWIYATKLFSRTSEDITFAPEPGGIYLPLILKN